MPSTKDNLNNYEKLGLNTSVLRELAALLVENFRTNHKPIPVSVEHVKEQIIPAAAFFAKSFGYLETNFRNGMQAITPGLSEEEIDDAVLKFLGDKKTTSLALMSGLTTVGFYNRHAETIPEGWLKVTDLKNGFRPADGSEIAFDDIYAVIEKKVGALVADGKSRIEAAGIVKEELGGWFVNTTNPSLDKLTLYINPETAAEFGLVTKQEYNQAKAEKMEAQPSKKPLSREELRILDNAFSGIIQKHMERVSSVADLKSSLYAKMGELDKQIETAPDPKTALELQEEKWNAVGQTRALNAKASNLATFETNSIMASREIGNIADSFELAANQYAAGGKAEYVPMKKQHRVNFITTETIPQLEQAFRSAAESAGGSLLDEGANGKEMVAAKIKQYAERLTQNKGTYIDAVMEANAANRPLNEQDMGKVSASISADKGK